MLSRIKNKEKGFTLIELMIVVAIIGILAAIAIPQFASYRERAQDSGAQSALKNLATAQEGYYLEYDQYCSNANRGDLVTGQGWTSGSSYTVVVLASATNFLESWSATATHISSTNTFTYSSSAGGLQ